MNAWQGTITVEMPRRRAIVNISDAAARFNKIEAGTHECHVLGLFQYDNHEDETAPYFICELHNGQNIYADPLCVRFVDTDENGEIIDEDVAVVNDRIIVNKEEE